MKLPIIYINRRTGLQEEEKIYYEKTLRFLYGKTGSLFNALISKIPFFSKLYGFLQKRPSSKAKILPFIKKYNVDLSEFEKKLEEYSSFNDFFTRKLKVGARTFASDLIIPADGRYFFYPNVAATDGFVVKGKKFSLLKLLGSQKWANFYAQGQMVIARLCPSDYHRFHFPCNCFAHTPQLINGALYSVNPIAIKKNIEIFTENKRMLTLLESEIFGKILFLEIGATNIGSIVQTFTPEKMVKIGEEKGYFSFGGSSLILLFEPNAIQFDSDLLANSRSYKETLCHFGQSLGISTQRKK